jgi:oligo-alginate lyase
MKTQSAFFGPDIVRVIRKNAAGRAADLTSAHKEKAAWWLEKSYEELHGLMFGPSLKRSWFVLSYGACPACAEGVPLYHWLIDAKANPWKVGCPHCGVLFPTNDFAAYYQSGLDEKGIFDRSLADPALLINADGTSFGVDDGNGYVNDGGERWLFVAAYLVHGHWFQLITEGIEALSFSYLLTGNREYARRAAIMLYRVSELFAGFDFEAQGVMYEEENSSSGYVSYWVNTCHDLKLMALAYDMIFDSMADDDDLCRVLGRAAEEIHQSIQVGILEEALGHPEKYDSNPPDPAFLRIIMKAVLNWPENSVEVESDFDRLIHDSTGVDGLSGEKGLASYAALVPVKLADAMLLFLNLGGRDIEGLLARYPILKKTYRFHIDTWYAATYYPGCGDGGYFGVTYPEYPGTLPPNYLQKPYFRGRQWFTWKLHEYFDDPDFARTIYLSNGCSIDGTFEHDIFLEDPLHFRNALGEVIDDVGSELTQNSVVYDEWRIAVLHSGTGDNRRMISVGYDSGANHSHHDALNINVFFKKANLSPDFGYPPVNYGGWVTKEVDWYRHPASHNLVVIDGQGHTNLPDGKFMRFPAHGKVVHWQGEGFAQAVCADAHEYAGVERFERVVGLVDVTDRDAYVVDIFRVKGGTDHTKFFRAPLAEVTTSGLSLCPGESYGNGSIMRDFTTDGAPAPGWSVEFLIDRKRELRLSHVDLTDEVSATLCESWVDITRMKASDGGNRVIWVPTLMVRRRGPESTFVSVLIPTEGSSFVKSVRRIKTDVESDVVIEIALADGRTDLILASDPASGGVTTSPFLVTRHPSR